MIGMWVYSGLVLLLFFFTSAGRRALEPLYVYQLWMTHKIDVDGEEISAPRALRWGANLRGPFGISVSDPTSLSPDALDCMGGLSSVRHIAFPWRQIRPGEGVLSPDNLLRLIEQTLELPNVINTSQSVDIRCEALTNLPNFPEFQRVYHLGLKLGDVPDLQRLAGLSKTPILSFVLSANLNSLRGIENLDQLREVHLMVLTGIETADQMRELSQLKKLRSISVQGLPSLDQTGAIEDFPLLASISAHGCDSMAAVGPLRNLPRLKEASFWSCQMLRDVEVSGFLPNLETLDFNNCPRLESFEFVSQVPNLKYILISGCPGIKSLQPLADAEKLEKVFLNGNNDAFTEIDVLADLPNLKTIHLSDHDKLTSVPPRLAARKDVFVSIEPNYDWGL